MGDCMTGHQIADMERRIVKAVVYSLTRAGFQLQTDDGEEKSCWLTDPELVLSLCFGVDDLWLIARRSSDGKRGWVRLVYGNDGWDVLSDYTVNLETELGPANRLSDRLERRARV